MTSLTFYGIAIAVWGSVIGLWSGSLILRGEIGGNKTVPLLESAHNNGKPGDSSKTYLHSM